MQARRRGQVIAALVLLLVAGLPLAVWLDLRYITKTALATQAAALSTAITGITTFYADDVVGRVQSANGHAVVTAHYQSVRGGIPIPATFSLDLGQVVGAGQSHVGYRFVSQYPFRFRKPHRLDAFERAALVALGVGVEVADHLPVLVEGYDDRKPSGSR